MLRPTHDELKKRGVVISDVDTQAWGKFVHFNDPDGNTWTLQELPPAPANLKFRSKYVLSLKLLILSSAIHL